MLYKLMFWCFAALMVFLWAVYRRYTLEQLHAIDTFYAVAANAIIAYTVTDRSAPPAVPERRRPTIQAPA